VRSARSDKSALYNLNPLQTARPFLPPRRGEVAACLASGTRQKDF